MKNRINPIDNSFVVDGNLLTDFIDNSDKYNNPPLIDHWLSLQKSLIDGNTKLINSKYLIEKTVKIMETYDDNNKKKKFPILHDTLKEVRETISKGSGNFQPIDLDDLNSDDSKYKTLFLKDKNVKINEEGRYVFKFDNLIVDSDEKGYSKISENVKKYDAENKNKVNIEPISFFEHYATLPANTFFIYDPYFFSENNIILGFNQRLELQEEEFPIYMQRILFYLSWIDKCIKGTNIVPKIYFLGRIEDQTAGHFFYAEKLFRIFMKKDFKNFPRYFTDKNGVQNFFGSSKVLQTSNLKLLKKYFINDDIIELMSYQRKDMSKKIDRTLTVTQGADHRNIVMTDYMNSFWDLRKNYIVSKPLGKNPNARFVLGDDPDGQTIVIQSIFNDTLKTQKNNWNKLYESANSMMQISVNNKRVQTRFFEKALLENFEESNKNNTNKEKYIGTVENIIEKENNLLLLIISFDLNKTDNKKFNETLKNADKSIKNYKARGRLFINNKSLNEELIVGDTFSGFRVKGYSKQNKLFNLEIKSGNKSIDPKGLSPLNLHKLYLKKCDNIFSEEDLSYSSKFEELNKEMLSKFNSIPLEVGKKAKVINGSFRNEKGIVEKITDNKVTLKIIGFLDEPTGKVIDFNISDVEGVKK